MASKPTLSKSSSSSSSSSSSFHSPPVNTDIFSSRPIRGSHFERRGTTRVSPIPQRREHLPRPPPLSRVSLFSQIPTQRANPTHGSIRTHVNPVESKAPRRERPPVRVAAGSSGSSSSSSSLRHVPVTQRRAQVTQRIGETTTRKPARITKRPSLPLTDTKGHPPRAEIIGDPMLQLEPGLYLEGTLVQKYPTSGILSGLRSTPIPRDVSKGAEVNDPCTYIDWATDHVDGQGRKIIEPSLRAVLVKEKGKTPTSQFFDPESLYDFLCVSPSVPPSMLRFSLADERTITQLVEARRTARARFEARSKTGSQGSRLPPPLQVLRAPKDLRAKNLAERQRETDAKLNADALESRNSSSSSSSSFLFGRFPFSLLQPLLLHSGHGGPFREGPPGFSHIMLSGPSLFEAMEEGEDEGVLNIFAEPMMEGQEYDNDEEDNNELDENEDISTQRAILASLVNA